MKLFNSILVLASMSWVIAGTFANADEMKAIHVFTCDIQLAASADGISKVDVFFKDFDATQTYLAARGTFRGNEQGVLLSAKSELKEDRSVVITAEIKEGEAIILTMQGEPNFGKIESSKIYDPFTKKETPSYCRVLKASDH